MIMGDRLRNGVHDFNMASRKAEEAGQFLFFIFIFHFALFSCDHNVSGDFLFKDVCFLVFSLVNP